MKKYVYFIYFLVIGLLFAACSTDTNDNSKGDGIKWDNEPTGTLSVNNSTLMDIVLFRGQVPTTTSILGGVRGSSTKTFDLTNVVDDFDIGGYMVLRGMTINEYNNNKSNLSNAKIEYSEIITYGLGKSYSAKINPSYFGNYCFRVNNTGQTGVELRKDSPNGEKISYIPPFATNYTIYSNSANTITVYPVYLFYNKAMHELISILPDSIEDSVSISPRHITDASIITYIFSNDL
jgi:hypothetical protein